MSKFFVVLLIVSLILSTALIKNSTKRVDDDIFILKENIRSLKKDFETIKLEYDYLSSADKLLEFQSLYFDDELLQRDIKSFKVIKENRDNLEIKQYLEGKDCVLVDPNCPGVITPDEAKVGIMPGFVFKKGSVGIVSKSGTLTYEASDQVVKEGLGVSTAIGIGGDPIIGTTTKDAIELFMNDDETNCIVMIGEIGGQLEADAARWIKENGNKKPVVGFVAGETAPKGRTMGHAGAIVGGKDDTAEAKKRIMRECGIHVVDSPAQIGKKVLEVLS